MPPNVSRTAQKYIKEQIIAHGGNLRKTISQLSATPQVILNRVSESEIQQSRSVKSDTSDNKHVRVQINLKRLKNPEQYYKKSKNSNNEECVASFSVDRQNSSVSSVNIPLVQDESCVRNDVTTVHECSVTENCVSDSTNELTCISETDSEQHCTGDAELRDEQLSVASNSSDRTSMISQRLQELFGDGELPDSTTVETDFFEKYRFADGDITINDANIVNSIEPIKEERTDSELQNIKKIKLCVDGPFIVCDVPTEYQHEVPVLGQSYVEENQSTVLSPLVQFPNGTYTDRSNQLMCESQFYISYTPEIDENMRLEETKSSISKRKSGPYVLYNDILTKKIKLSLPRKPADFLVPIYADNTDGFSENSIPQIVFLSETESESDSNAENDDENNNRKRHLNENESCVLKRRYMAELEKQNGSINKNQTRSENNDDSSGGDLQTGQEIQGNTAIEVLQIMDFELSMKIKNTDHVIPERKIMFLNNSDNTSVETQEDNSLSAVENGVTDQNVTSNSEIPPIVNQPWDYGLRRSFLLESKSDDFKKTTCHSFENISDENVTLEVVNETGDDDTQAKIESIQNEPETASSGEIRCLDNDQSEIASSPSEAVEVQIDDDHSENESFFSFTNSGYIWEVTIDDSGAIIYEHARVSSPDAVHLNNEENTIKYTAETTDNTLDKQNGKEVNDNNINPNESKLQNNADSHKINNCTVPEVRRTSKTTFEVRFSDIGQNMDNQLSANSTSVVPEVTIAQKNVLSPSRKNKGKIEILENKKVNFDISYIPIENEKIINEDTSLESQGLTKNQQNCQQSLSEQNINHQLNMVEKFVNKIEMNKLVSNEGKSINPGIGQHRNSNTCERPGTNRETQCSTEGPSMVRKPQKLCENLLLKQNVNRHLSTVGKIVKKTELNKLVINGRMIITQDMYVPLPMSDFEDTQHRLQNIGPSTSGINNQNTYVSHSNITQVPPTPPVPDISFQKLHKKQVYHLQHSQQQQQNISNYQSPERNELNDLHNLLFAGNNRSISHKQNFANMGLQAFPHSSNSQPQYTGNHWPIGEDNRNNINKIVPVNNKDNYVKHYNYPYLPLHRNDLAHNINNRNSNYQSIAGNNNRIQNGQIGQNPHLRYNEINQPQAILSTGMIVQQNRQMQIIAQRQANIDYNYRSQNQATHHGVPIYNGGIMRPNGTNVTQNPITQILNNNTNSGGQFEYNNTLPHRNIHVPTSTRNNQNGYPVIDNNPLSYQSINQNNLPNNNSRFMENVQNHPRFMNQQPNIMSDINVGDSTQRNMNRAVPMGQPIMNNTQQNSVTQQNVLYKQLMIDQQIMSQQSDQLQKMDQVIVVLAKQLKERDIRMQQRNIALHGNPNIAHTADSNLDRKSETIMERINPPPYNQPVHRNFVHQVGKSGSIASATSTHNSMKNPPMQQMIRSGTNQLNAPPSKPILLSYPVTELGSHAAGHSSHSVSNEVLTGRNTQQILSNPCNSRNNSLFKIEKLCNSFQGNPPQEQSLCDNEALNLSLPTLIEGNSKLQKSANANIGQQQNTTINTRQVQQAMESVRSVEENINQPQQPTEENNGLLQQSVKAKKNQKSTTEETTQQLQQPTLPNNTGAIRKQPQNVSTGTNRRQSQQPTEVNADQQQPAVNMLSLEPGTSSTRENNYMEQEYIDIDIYHRTVQRRQGSAPRIASRDSGYMGSPKEGASCIRCGGPPNYLCSQCRKSYYCSMQCQKCTWKDSLTRCCSGV